MSFWGHKNPKTPFCPCLDANLSPSSGILSSLAFILTSLFPSSVSLNKTKSIIPFSEGLTPIDVSRLPSIAVPNSSSSSKNLGGLVLPIKTSPPFTLDSGLMNPSISRFS